MIVRFGLDGYLGQESLALARHSAGERAAHLQRQIQDDEGIESGDVKDVSVFRIS